jgi:proteic killer suppression protein
MGRKSRAVSEQARRRAVIKLEQLNEARELEELTKPPGNRLHRLAGVREGQWSISVNEQYRICFRFDEQTGDSHDVEVTDYH